MNEAKTETIPATDTGAQHATDALTQAIPWANEPGTKDAAFAESAEVIWTGPHPAIAESAEIIWSPAVAATTDSRLTSEIAPMSATMVEVSDTAQFFVTARIPEPAQTAEPAQAAEPAQTAEAVRAAESAPAAESLPAVARARGRHAAPRPAGTRPAAAGLAKRCEGRHAAARPAGSVARRLAATAGSVAMVAVGLHAVAG